MPEPTTTEMPALATLSHLVDRFADARIVVWGDVVADRFVYGSTTRISREAPALVLRREGEEIRPGGAGNAMMNCAALGAQVRAVGYLGADETGLRLRQALEAAGVDDSHLIERGDAPTPVKTRIMAGGQHTVRQQILRIDADPPWPEQDDARAALRAALDDTLADTDALLISDYGMGNVCPATVSDITAPLRARGAVVVADSRCALLSYRGVDVVTPNEEEVEGALEIAADSLDDHLDDAGARLLDQLSCRAALITRGSRGMSLYEVGADPIHLPIHGSDQIADVTGAGDAVIATFTAAQVVGASLLEAARIANVAAGLVVMKRGTAAVPAQELRDALESAD